MHRQVCRRQDPLQSSGTLRSLAGITEYRVGTKCQSVFRCAKPPRCGGAIVRPMGLKKLALQP